MSSLITPSFFSSFFVLLLLIHLCSTAFMTGLIWLIQHVHYPLFAEVGLENHLDYHRLHVFKITWIVVPVMLVECGCTFLLWLALFNTELTSSNPLLISFYQLPSFRILVWGGALLLALIWMSTACLQVPAHNLLSQSFNTDVHEYLVRWNWIRTIGWSARLVLSAWMLYLFVYHTTTNTHI